MDTDDAAYRKNLEDLVNARTEHLRQFLECNEVLLGALKQIQNLDSLEQAKETAQAAIDKVQALFREQVPQKLQKFGGQSR